MCLCVCVWRFQLRRRYSRAPCGRISSAYEPFSSPVARSLLHPSGFPLPVIHFGRARPPPHLTSLDLLRVIDECECRMPNGVHANFTTPEIDAHYISATTQHTHTRTLLRKGGRFGRAVGLCARVHATRCMVCTI